MSETSFKVEGMEDLISTLKDLPVNISKNVLKGSTYQGAKVLAELVRSQAPVGTVSAGHQPGDLKRSIVAKQARRIAADGTAYSNVHGLFYGRMLEYGTSKMPAHPWIRAIFDREVSTVVKAVADGFQKSFEKVIKRAAKKLRKG